jgi:hypothetical protein
VLKALDDWLVEIETKKPYGWSLDPVADAADYAREKQQFEGVDLRGWRAGRDAMARGLTILEKAFESKSKGKASDDPEVVPLTAWRFMNQTFGEFWRTKNKDVKSWRLFQIAFILSQLPAIVSRLACWKADAALTAAEDREATLLYFSTGGGKSESFFGLLVFCLAFDRLRGKQRGITALLRYPLRLLTSQQAQRLSQVLAAAYKISWLWKDRGLDLKGKGFEIGFWVGGGNTPNNRNVRGVSEIPVLATAGTKLRPGAAITPSIWRSGAGLRRVHFARVHWPAPVESAFPRLVCAVFAKGRRRKSVSHIFASTKSARGTGGMEPTRGRTLFRSTLWIRIFTRMRPRSCWVPSISLPSSVKAPEPSSGC